MESCRVWLENELEKETQATVDANIRVAEVELMANLF